MQINDNTYFQPGDLVFVRDDLSLYSQYAMFDNCNNHINAAQSMVDMCGECVTIAEVFQSAFGPRYRIVEDGGEYQWTDNMFSGYAITDEVFEPEDIDILYDWF